MPNTPVMDGLIRRTVQRHLPWSVHVDLTYRCNERCIHCYLDHEDHGEMKTQEIKNVLEQLAQTGTLFLTFSGGEIFLRADLFELLEFARSLHFDISLKTNALLIDSERARKLRDLRVRKIQISIYSAEPEVHDAITKVRGSLERTLAAIRFLQAEGLQVKIACPLMKQNLTAYRNVQALAAELGVPYVLDMTITPKMDGDMSLLQLRSSTTELLPILQDASLNPRACSPNSLEAETISTGGATGSATSSGIESQAYEDIPCSAGHNSCYISPYGDVFPCVQMPVATGNLRKQTFEDIWFRSEEMNRVRAVRESQLPLCSKCSIRQYCERCPGLAQMEGGDLLGAYERACELAELNARIAGVANPVSAMHAEKSNSKNTCSIPVPTVVPEVRMGSN
ncbi:MAG TPA: radical SAM protein [Candidatus Binatus sp.]|jgi:radical SAM protein with 4Fe4S-binding SPASM domain|nr:radical SAM protein [Candidatus Binatus sp.]